MKQKKQQQLEKNPIKNKQTTTRKKKTINCGAKTWFDSDFIWLWTVALHMC